MFHLKTQNENTKLGSKKTQPNQTKTRSDRRKHSMARHRTQTTYITLTSSPGGRTVSKSVSSNITNLMALSGANTFLTAAPIHTDREFVPMPHCRHILWLLWSPLGEHISAMFEGATACMPLEIRVFSAWLSWLLNKMVEAQLVMPHPETPPYRLTNITRSSHLETNLCFIRLRITHVFWLGLTCVVPQTNTTTLQLNKNICPKSRQTIVNKPPTSHQNGAQNHPGRVSEGVLEAIPYNNLKNLNPCIICYVSSTS